MALKTGRGGRGENPGSVDRPGHAQTGCWRQRHSGQIFFSEALIACDKAFGLKAIGFSHIITGDVKAHTGRLSAVCGCSIAAGAGAAAGIAYLLGGSIQQIGAAIKNLTEDLAGVICDGAKAGCALKLATAAGSAVQAALFALQGGTVRPTDGIVGASPEQTMQNVGQLSTQGRIETDRTILKIMLQKMKETNA